MAGPAATAEDDAAIRAQAGAEFSGFSAGAKEWSPKGGGGGGSPVVPRPPPPILNVAGREPASALSALAGLPPAQILGAMGGVAAAASTAVGKKEKALAASPPTKRIAEGPAGPGAPPAKPSLDAKVEEIKPSGGKEPEAKAGEEHIEAPPIMLSGETDPANVTAQEGAAKVAATSASSAAKSGLAAPRGEERLNPKVKAQTVKPEVPVGSGRVDVASEPAAEDASIVAFQEKPGELHSAVAKGSGEMTKGSSEASKQEAEHQKASDAEINKAEAEHAKQLKEEQAKGRGAVDKERKEADAQHAKLLSSHSTEASAKKAEVITHVNTEKVKGDAEAKRHVGEANTKIAAEKRKGQEQARKAELEERKKDSGGGIWGAIKRAASAVVDAVKSAVKAVMDAVKSAVKSIVSTVVSAVGSVLKGVWNAIKSVVKAAIDALKKLASAFLDALKALIDAALALIDSIIKAALAALQALAALLPGILGKLLSALVSVLKAVYDGLKAAYKAAIEAVKSAVAAVVSWAKAAIEALGMLAGLVKDIASAPGRWFSNLLSSVKDGIMVHLFWAPLSAAIKKWWDDKVKGLIGAPKAVLDMLVKGGITFKEVLVMAWDAIKSALPEIVIQQLIEKVVSALNVGAGTALLLLRTLQAAWASIGAIIGAIQKFFGFLKAVKGGSAGGQFAEAVAAGAVAVIEFVSNFLMARLGSKLKPFKDKLGGLAKKIGEKLLGATKKAGSKIVAAGKAALDKVRKSKFGQLVKTGADKAGDLKKKYDKWKYGDAEGKSKWASAEAAEDAAWSDKVHQKTGGRFGEASTSSTPHHPTGGDKADTSSTATHPDAEGSGTGTTQHPDHDTKARHPSEDGANEIKVKEDGAIEACPIQRCPTVSHTLDGESDDDAARRVAAISDDALPPRELPAGSPGHVVANALEPHELAQAQSIVDLRGGTLVGNSRSSAAGIDGTLDGVPVSLKTYGGSSPAGVLSHASRAERSAANAGFTNVEVFIEAPGVSQAILIDFAQKGPLGSIPRQGTVRTIYVRTADGWVVFPG